MTSIKLTGLFLVVTLPFTAVGLWLGSLALKPLLEWHATRAWKEVPADILATNLDVYVTSEGGEMYRARAIYGYSSKRSSGTKKLSMAWRQPGVAIAATRSSAALSAASVSGLVT